jgi:hypothetical protein
MTDRPVQREVAADDTGATDSEDELIARITDSQRAGRDTSQEVRALLKLAAKANRAALDRLSG